MKTVYPLVHRGFLAITGEEALSFLQGILTQNTLTLARGAVCYAFLLTPQGRYLFDIFLAKTGEGFLIEGEEERIEALATHLKIFRLRKRIDFTPVKTFESVYYAPYTSDFFQELVEILPNSFVFQDPRDSNFGIRIWLHGSDRLQIQQFKTLQGYRFKRLLWGMPEGSADFTFQKSIPLEWNFDILKGIDTDKGCYTGQELMARMQHRGLIRKRVLPFTAGHTVTRGDAVLNYGAEVGDVAAFHEGAGFVRIKREAFGAILSDPGILEVGAGTITVSIPNWLEPWIEKEAVLS